MSNFNFSGVEVAKEISNGFKAVEPGFQKLTITGVEDTTANSGSEGFKVSFESEKGGTFNQNWYLKSKEGSLNKAVMESFQYLVSTFTSNLLSGEVNTAALSALLVGKSAEVTVGGRRYTNEKDGKKYNNIAAELPFGGYAGERAPYYRGQWDQEEANTDIQADDPTADLPF